MFLKNTFKYLSPYWSDKQSYDFEGGLSAFDDQETKLPTYWSTSFNELCVGMKVANNLNFASVSLPAYYSLYSLIADGDYRATIIGREKWKALINGSSLQYNCNKEGFNVLATHSQVSIRLGIMGNNQERCSTADSFIGFGGRIFSKLVCRVNPSLNTAGNLALCGPDNGDKNIKVMGYILGR